MTYHSTNREDEDKRVVAEAHDWEDWFCHTGRGSTLRELEQDF
jgi:hypothetical protein